MVAVKFQPTPKSLISNASFIRQKVTISVADSELLGCQALVLIERVVSAYS